MKIFEYKSVKPTGQIYTGEVRANNAREAVAILSSDLSVVVYTKEISALRKLTNAKIFEQTITLRDRLAFMRQMQSLFDAGLPLIDSIVTIQSVMANKRFKRILGDIVQKMSAGESFSQCLERYPDLFSESFTAMVKAGEASGSLSTMMAEQCELLEWENKLGMSIKNAVRYPIIVLSMGTLALIFIVTFILPKFTPIFKMQEATLPWITRFLLGISYGITHFWVQILLGIAALIGLYMWIKSTEVGRRKIDMFALKFPLFGPLYLKYIVARFAKICAITYDSGVDIMKSLSICHGLFPNRIYQDEISRISDGLKDGMTLGEAYQTSDFFDPLAKQMVRTGEKSGDLGPMLRKLSHFYTVEVNYVTDNFFAIIEPVIVIGMGLMVLMVALAIFIPMIGMLGLVG